MSMKKKKQTYFKRTKENNMNVFSFVFQPEWKISHSLHQNLMPFVILFFAFNIFFIASVWKIHSSFFQFVIANSQEKSIWVKKISSKKWPSNRYSCDISQKRYGHQFIGKVILLAKLFLNSHLHHLLFPLEITIRTHCFFPTHSSLLKHQHSAFTIPLFSFWAYVFYV